MTMAGFVWATGIEDTFAQARAPRRQQPGLDADSRPDRVPTDATQSCTASDRESDRPFYWSFLVPLCSAGI